MKFIHIILVSLMLSQAYGSEIKEGTARRDTVERIFAGFHYRFFIDSQLGPALEVTLPVDTYSSSNSAILNPEVAVELLQEILGVSHTQEETLKRSSLSKISAAAQWAVAPLFAVFSKNPKFQRYHDSVRNRTVWGVPNQQQALRVSRNHTDRDDLWMWSEHSK